MWAARLVERLDELEGAALISLELDALNSVTLALKSAPFDELPARKTVH
jgi:hypothetical protein